MVTPSPPGGSGVSNAVRSPLQSDLEGEDHALDIFLYYIKKKIKSLTVLLFFHSFSPFSLSSLL